MTRGAEGFSVPGWLKRPASLGIQPRMMPVTAEAVRLEEARRREKHWKRWGPYLSERAWGTVREDYSPGGNAWDYFPHDHARSRAYRWNEDGLAGICDRHQRICFAIALWNGRDAILKERLFGLTGSEGNHGEDVKEYYFYLDSTPTHSYMKFLYKYPQAPFPYADLVDENRRRDRSTPEYELVDTGVFSESRYFDVEVEYAKADPEDLLIRIHVTNRGPERAAIDVLPTVWFRNTWSWSASAERPRLAADGPTAIALDDPVYGRRWLHCDGDPATLFTENDTNTQRLFGHASATPYTKDAFHRFVIDGQADAVNQDGHGTKAAARYTLSLEPGARATLRLRFNAAAPAGAAFGAIGCSRLAAARRTSSTPACCRSRCHSTPATWRDRRSPACCGRSSSTTTKYASGSKVMRRSRRRPATVILGVTVNGSTSTTPTSSRCRTSGSTRGTRPGISRFIASRSR
jgi:hypothetical protein